MLGIVAATASLYGAIEEVRYQRLRGLYAERDALTKETSLTETTIFDMKRYAQVMKEIKKIREMNRSMVTNTRPSPPNLVSVVSQVQHESYQAWLQAQAMSGQQHHFQSQQNVAQQQVYERELIDYYSKLSEARANDYRNANVKHEPTIPKEYEELADPSSPMFDPLTCIKNGVKVKAPPERKYGGKQPV